MIWERILLKKRSKITWEDKNQYLFVQPNQGHNKQNAMTASFGGTPFNDKMST